MGGNREQSGRVWAWLLLFVGGGVSLAINVGHAYVGSDASNGGPAGWAVAWALAWAVLVPLMLFVAVRGVMLIRWPDQRRWRLWRWCSAAPVAGLAGYMSWSHTSGLLTWLGEDWLVCVLAWLAVDGLMFLGIGGLLATRRTPTPAPGATAQPEANGATPRPTRFRFFTPVGGA